MKIVETVLANLIRAGKVRVELPNVDIEKLVEITRSYTMEMLLEIEDIVEKEGMTDTEKVALIDKRLKE